MTRAPAAIAGIALAGAACTATPAGGGPGAVTEESRVITITPIMVVDAVEPCLAFWTERLGFETVATVPHGDAVGFAMLQRDDAVVMYQSRASVEDDLVAAAPARQGLAEELAGSTSALFVKVDGLDPVLDAMAGVEIVVPRRQTFYGMDEVFVRAPCGSLVGLAAPLADTREEPG